MRYTGFSIWLLIACVVQAATPSAIAPEARQPGGISIVRAWSRATPAGASTGVAYFEILNTGAADTLIAIDCPLAQRVEIHSMVLVDGSMQMRLLRSADVPAEGRVVFGPGALHAMLIGLKGPLNEGARLPLTLKFRGGGKYQIEAVIQGLGATSGPAPIDVKGSPAAGDSSFRLAIWPQRAESPDFRLIDFEGRPRTVADYRGRVLVIFFGFLHCADACPAELFKLSLAMKQLGRLSDHVQVLFVTLDPERDTPALLKGYVTAFDARFVGLTGSAAFIDKAAESFHVEYARVGSADGYSIDHSTSTFVFDARGRLRLVATISASAGDYAHDLAVLTRE